MATFSQKPSEPPVPPREGVNVGVNALLAYVQAHPGQQAAEMAVVFSVTKRTIERWLKQLKDSQRIEFRGAPKTGGYHPKDQ